MHNTISARTFTEHRTQNTKHRTQDNAQGKQQSHKQQCSWPHPFPRARPVTRIQVHSGQGWEPHSARRRGEWCAHQAVEFDICVDGARHSAQKLQSITFVITRASTRSARQTLSRWAPRHRSRSVATTRYAPQRPPRSHDVRHDCSDSVSISCCADHHLAPAPQRPHAPALSRPS